MENHRSGNSRSFRSFFERRHTDPTTALSSGSNNPAKVRRVAGNRSHSTAHSFSDLSSKAVEENFETLLSEMNLDEVRKVPLRSKTLDEKRRMLEAFHSRRTGDESAYGFVSEIKAASSESFLESRRQNLLDLLERLRISLQNRLVTWIREFDKFDGLRHLFTLMMRNKKDQQLINVSLRCIRAFGNSGYGLEQLLKHDTAIVILAQCLDVEGIGDSNLLAVVELLAAVGSSPEGHSKLLDALSQRWGSSCKLESREDRFGPIIQGLGKPVLRQACLQLLNVILSPPFDEDGLELHHRLHLRLEMMSGGELRRHLANLATVASDESAFYEEPHLAEHLAIFRERARLDEAELLERFDESRVSLDAVDDCFRLLERHVANTDSAPLLLSILQHLLFIPDEPNVRRHYFRLIEGCVAQIVLQGAGDINPDLKYATSCDNVLKVRSYEFCSIIFC